MSYFIVQTPIETKLVEGSYGDTTAILARKTGYGDMKWKIHSLHKSHNEAEHEISVLHEKYKDWSFYKQEIAGQFVPLPGNDFKLMVLPEVSRYI